MVNGLYPRHATPIRTRQHINGWNDMPKQVRAIVRRGRVSSAGIVERSGKGPDAGPSPYPAVSQVFKPQPPTL